MRYRKFTLSKHVKHLGKASKEVMKVLSCDVEDIIDVSDRWEEAVSGTLLFVHPDCERDNIGYVSCSRQVQSFQNLTIIEYPNIIYLFTNRPILETCLPPFLKSTDVTLLDRIKIAILQLDDVKVQEMQQ